jgi:hypothetical protein
MLKPSSVDACKTFTFHSSQIFQLTRKEQFAQDWTVKTASKKISFEVIANHKLFPFDLQVDCPATDFDFIISLLQDSLGISIGLHDSWT